MGISLINLINDVKKEETPIWHKDFELDGS